MLTDTAYPRGSAARSSTFALGVARTSSTLAHMPLTLHTVAACAITATVEATATLAFVDGGVLAVITTLPPCQ